MVRVVLAAFAVATASLNRTPPPVAPPTPPPNPAIDPAGHQRLVHEALRVRETRRLTEADFLRLMREPGTVVLDARSRDKFEMLHIKGAVNLPFPDIDIPTLARVLPDKQARILIYCNNNFRDVGPAMFDKSPRLSLNLSTFPALHGSGYTNVWELGPRLDPATTKLPLAGTDTGRATGR